MADEWENAEDLDFTVTSAPGDGVTWIWLRCSACGPLTAAAQPRDLGYLSADAQLHYERKHLREQAGG
jgi:hypothetical protein